MYKLLLPKFGMTMQSGYIGRWFRQEGDRVNKGDLLLEVESEKITNDVSCPVDGFIKNLIGEEGEEYKIGTLIALIAETPEELAAAVPESAATPLREEAPSARTTAVQNKGGEFQETLAEVDRSEVKASPAAKKLAREKGIDLSSINGSGPGGRIIEHDVLSISGQSAEKAGPIGLEFEEILLSPTRQTIARELGNSYHAGVFVTQCTIASCEGLYGIKQNNDVSVTAVLAKFVGLALLQVPQLNAHFDGKVIRQFQDVHLGIATQTDQGLLVPTLRDVNKKTLPEIHESIKKLSEAARSRKLTSEQTQGSTFTISNVGISRTDAFTPILHFPEVAILGVGRIHKGLQVDDENGIHIVRQCWLSLTYDHRVVDGAIAAIFLEKMSALLERLNASEWK